ncbi:MAG TPA: hypothetical protein VGM54_10890 [Chthoniobacter sp.]
MNYIEPGLRELARILDRLVRRGALWWEHRKLGHCEVRLGLLGWQQADYGEGTRDHVDRLADFERTQSQLTNESASLALTLQQLEERRTSERKTYESQRAERLAAQQPLVKQVEEQEKELSAMRRERAKVEEWLGSAEREHAASEDKYRSLLATGNHDPKLVQEVTRLQQKSLSIPQEKLEHQGKLNELQESMGRLEAELQEERARISLETEALKTLEKSFTESDEALAKEIAARRRDKQKLERQVNDLEKAKSHPYREIGKVLADHGIEPLNQPEALTDVLNQRAKVAAVEEKIAASRQMSSLEKRDHVWGSWVLLLSIVVILWVGIWVALHPR